MPSWKQRNNTPMNLDKRDIKRKNNFESGNTRKNYGNKTDILMFVFYLKQLIFS